MLIVLNKVIVRNGHLEKIMPLVRDNVKYGTELKGYIEGNISRGVDNNNEIMIYSRWQSHEDYEEAKKTIKKDPRSKKLMFQCLPHVSKYETLIYEIMPLSF